MRGHHCRVGITASWLRSTPGRSGIKCGSPAAGRLSGHDIGRSDYVEAEVRVYSLVGVIVGSVSNPDSQVGSSLLPELYDVKLITMNEHGMLLKGEKRPHGDARPAYIQEWSVMVER